MGPCSGNRLQGIADTFGNETEFGFVRKSRSINDLARDSDVKLMSSSWSAVELGSFTTVATLRHP
jgi:hypothetical protein